MTSQNLYNKTVLLNLDISKEKRNLSYFNCGIHFFARTNLFGFICPGKTEDVNVNIPSNHYQHSVCLHNEALHTATSGVGLQDPPEPGSR